MALGFSRTIRSGRGRADVDESPWQYDAVSHALWEVIMRRTRFLAAFASGLVAALVVAGCGGNNSTTSGGGGSPSASVTLPSEDPALAKMVPSQISSDGKLTVGTDTTYPPAEYLSAQGDAQGFDIDLFNAVAAKLGLKTSYVTAPFPNIIPSVQSGKYEIGVSSFSINADREKVVDMVSYFAVGTAWATQKGNPAGVSLDNACGKTIAVQKGTVQVDDITARSTACTDAGKPAITIDQFQGQDQATTAVVSGKDDAMLADYPVVVYAVQQTGGKLQQLGGVYNASPYGYAIKKGQGQFAVALQKAVDAIIADGTYMKVLKHWGVELGAVKSAAINPTVP